MAISEGALAKPASLDISHVVTNTNDDVLKRIPL